MPLIWLLLGLLFVLVGTIWTLQGFGVLGGSSMSNDTTWAIVGLVAVVVGVAMMLIGRWVRDHWR